MRAACVHIVGHDAADLATVDSRARLVFPLHRPRAIAEHLRVLLAFLLGVGAVLLRPCLALGETIRRQRRIGLDLAVKEHAGVDDLVLDCRVGLWVGGEDREGEARECADEPHPANERDECSGVHGNSFEAMAGGERNYSAASLWPSRALRSCISSAAASAITVPIGKVASAAAFD